jgi:transcription antitermination factor NusG
MSKQWYVLRSKANSEESLSREVHARGFEVFCPQIRVRPVNPRSRKVLPYFPGYMFVNVDLPAVGYSAFMWLPQSYGLVIFGQEASSVPDELIYALQLRVDEINEAGGESLLGLKHGATITIHDGPFVGYEALFDACTCAGERVRVLLKLLNRRMVSLELPAGQIQPEKRH